MINCRDLGLLPIPSASILETYRNLLYVAGDDSPWLHVQTVDGAQANQLSLVPELAEVPLTHRIPKPEKHDLEAGCVLPEGMAGPGAALLLLGSGSTDLRCVGCLVHLKADGTPEDEVEWLDNIAPLYDAINEGREPGSPDSLNLEGLCLYNGDLLLFNRALKSSRSLVTILRATTVVDLGREMLDEEEEMQEVYEQFLQLPTVNGLVYGVTGATIGPDGLYLTACAEDTGNSYDDGPVLGSQLGFLPFDAEGYLPDDELWKPTWTPLTTDAGPAGLKLESLAWVKQGNQRRLLAVSDNDAGESRLWEILR